jgi:hypothetical protein
MQMKGDKMGLFDIFKKKESDGKGKTGWRDIINSINDASKGQNMGNLLSLKEKYPSQIFFFLTFRQRFGDKAFLSIPFEYNDSIVEASRKYQEGFNMNDPLIKNLGLTDGYKPTYQFFPDNKFGRASNLVIDRMLVSVSSVLKGKKIQNEQELIKAAYETIDYFARLPIVSWFFSLPLLVTSPSTSPEFINKLETTILICTENLLLEIYGDLKEGEIIDEVKVQNKVKLYFG